MSNGYPRWTLIPLLAVAALATVSIGLSLYLHTAASPPYVDSLFFGWPFFGFGWFFIIPVIFLVFIGFRLLLWGSWGWGGGRDYGRYDDSALETLRQRFARGEITKEQFDQMKKDIGES
jgi:putative membrane protein